VNSSHRFEVATDLVAAQVMDGEVVVINLATGCYYTSNQAAGEIWPLLEQRQSLEALQTRLCDLYAVDRDTAGADLRSLLDLLEAEGIIRSATTEAESLQPESPPVAEKLPYEPPAFEVFRDMEQLLALDPPMPDAGEIPWELSDVDPLAAPHAT
jgi:hypothetical protein